MRFQFVVDQNYTGKLSTSNHTRVCSVHFVGSKLGYLVVYLIVFTSGIIVMASLSYFRQVINDNHSYSNDWFLPKSRTTQDVHLFCNFFLTSDDLLKQQNIFITSTNYYHPCHIMAFLIPLDLNTTSCIDFKQTIIIPVTKQIRIAGFYLFSTLSSLEHHCMY